MNFHAPFGRVALWTGIGAWNAFRLGLLRNRFTLEMTHEGQSLNNGLLKKELDRDFGSQWSGQKREIFSHASKKFVSRAAGKVDVFVKEGCTKIVTGMSINALDKIESKILFDELMDMELAGQVVGNGRIEIMQITEFNEKLEPIGTYSMPVSKEWN